MEKSSLQFLFKLLKTPSPSGNEVAYQKKWMEEVRKFAAVNTDEAGNVIGSLNATAPFKVLLCGHADEISMTVTGIDNNGFIRFTRSGGINPQILSGLRVTVFGFGGELRGVVGYKLDRNKEPEARLNIDDFFIDCGAKSRKEIEKKVRVGDYIIYDGEPEIILNNRLVGKALDDKTGSFIVAETLRNLSSRKLKVGVFGVSSTGEETNMRGAYFAGARIEPDLAIALDVTFNTDSPGEEGQNRAEVKIGEGPALSLGSAVNAKLNELIEKAAKKNKIRLQLELTPDKTSTDADKIHFSGRGVPVALISLPVRYMHSPVELASIDDIEAIIKLLVETIAALTGKESFRPL
jgi:endoglucanase